MKDQTELNRWRESLSNDKNNLFYKEMIKAHGGSYTAFRISEKKIKTILSQLGE